MNQGAKEQIQTECRMILEGQAELLKPLADSIVTISGAGFLGSWLSEMIISLNDVYSFQTKVNLITRNADKLEFERSHLCDRKEFNVIEEDVRNISEIPVESKWMIHTAACPDNRVHVSNPVETMSSIAMGTENILRCIDRCTNFEMLLNLSSGLVYGEQPMDLAYISEEFQGAPQINSLSDSYAESKRYSEFLCNSYRTQFHIPIINVRPFAFIGPYQSIESPWAINNFIKDAMIGRAIRVLGDGDTVRSYMYPSDAAFWILRILTSAKSGTYYNLGSDQAIKLSELASLIGKNFSSDVEILLSVGSEENNKSSRLVPDISKAKKEFDLSISVNLDEALNRTISFYQMTH